MLLTLLMLEYGLGVKKQNHMIIKINGLNPSYAGIWSRGLKDGSTMDVDQSVLTLLMLEYGLGVKPT